MNTMMDMNYITNTTESYDNNEVNGWIRFGMRLAVSTTLHPLEYSKILIQMGYEPIPARAGKSLLGKPIMVLPNIFQYADYIRKVDGFYGCYRGLMPRLWGSILGMAVSEKMADSLGLVAIDDRDKSDSEVSDDEFYARYKINLKREVFLTISAIVVSQPFHVVSVRMMAQFIGRETIYNSFFGSLYEIYKTEGFAGFFSGIAPKLLCDVTCLVLTNTAVFLINKYCIKDKVGRMYNAGFTQFVVSNLLYPMQVVATCSIVTGSRLFAGRPPFMPEYKNWLDCLIDLHRRGELKRGSSAFWRSTSNYPKVMPRKIDVSKYTPIPKYQ